MNCKLILRVIDRYRTAIENLSVTFPEAVHKRSHTSHLRSMLVLASVTFLLSCNRTTINIKENKRIGN